MRLELLTAAATDPVTLAEVKTRLRIDGSTDDAGVSRLIAAATRHAESICRRAFVTQSWALILDAFPCGSIGSIALPLPPLQTVDEVSYVDANGTTQILASTEYLVDKSGLIGMVHRAYNKTWPTTRAQPMAVKIKFTAGYGAAAAVPSDLISALMLLVAHWDQNREPVVVGAIVSAVPMSVDSLLAPYVIPGVV
jgi:uncharacterized phiE125 gp8 family phage protein